MRKVQRFPVERHVVKASIIISSNLLYQSIHNLSVNYSVCFSETKVKISFLLVADKGLGGNPFSLIQWSHIASYVV